MAIWTLTDTLASTLRNVDVLGIFGRYWIPWV